MDQGAETAIQGLSPRVRGNQVVGLLLHSCGGSIPACAGEPVPYCIQNAPPGVYPRVCGGTDALDALSLLEGGLSPRVRGNPPCSSPYPPSWGSIPACAGEPWSLPLSVKLPPVYPRVCGGTRYANAYGSPPCGLSPRVRGNRRRRMASGRAGGSIPACAGEPCPPACATQSPEVYPRVCGGTFVQTAMDRCSGGLSPRVRGNPWTERAQQLGDGSIPACAGEPCSQRAHRVEREVYPRVCGGTPQARRARGSTRGLSPRVRGNRSLSPPDPP